MMKWAETSAEVLPASLRDDVRIGKDVRIFRCGMLTVFVATENGMLHLSISHPMRYPNWDEIKAARYDLLPNDMTFALLLPPMQQYVNTHRNCFHLHELTEEEVRQAK
jgi:hypothetical protein